MQGVCDRLELEAREVACLAPYAQFSQATQGRVHLEPPPEWRTHYQRDRDRVIHSRAFRRLEYKTQVFLNGTGDHLRTRLTHTVEVAGIARNIARALRLNEDLCETIALAHDLGHAPYGHKGEETLDHLMKDHGGFEHNLQSLKIVEALERKYPGFPGLNLTWETREGLCKHHVFDEGHPHKPHIVRHQPSLEAQVANLADEIAYYNHDLDDGLESGLLNENQLSASVEAWRLAKKHVEQQFGVLEKEAKHFYVIRCLIDGMVRDVVHFTSRRLESEGVRNVSEVRASLVPLVTYSQEQQQHNLELREYLYRNLYYHPEVHEPNRRAVALLVPLFDCYLKNPSEMGAQYGQVNGQNELARAVCNYIAGMTDRFVCNECQRLGIGG